jgi:ABC-type polysaccharide/polyol phosphate transport system ATPase subunit
VTESATTSESGLARRDRPAIDLQDVSVRYTVPHERVLTFKEYLIRWARGRVRSEELQALARVSLQIRASESVGVIGRNGAGKSTLLKVIARVLRPTSGRVEVRGMVAPLLELGAGFDMELTGRENVFLNGAILRRPRAEMVRRLPDIVRFAELEQFIDAPLRTYSTGMVARLGFAVATDVQPDILLLDEVLSVGDIEFQEKCLARIQEFLARGATMILVSHAPQAIVDLCQRAVWMHEGRIAADGPAAEVVAAFVNQAISGHPKSAAG